jgi:hypothetical protein
MTLCYDEFIYSNEFREMELSSIIYLSLALSEPIVILVALLRTFVCIYRSHRSKQIKFTVYSILNAILLLLILSAIVVVWFGYGVSHSGKNQSTDLIVLTGTISIASLGSILAWWFSVNMDKSSVVNQR